tara:strand:+ start:311 stop:610 length:300 start_codon:yes stop_codon:yes gene_type:complete
MKTIVIKLLLISFLISCTEENADVNQLIFNDFQTSLQEEMDYNSIIKTFGEPVKDIGSGIHIYVYELTDSTEIWIGYTDYIVYAKHVDQDQNILHTLYE